MKYTKQERDYIRYLRVTLRNAKDSARYTKSLETKFIAQGKVEALDGALARYLLMIQQREEAYLCLKTTSTSKS